jgi:hypothetical protein
MSTLRSNDSKLLPTDINNYQTQDIYKNESNKNQLYMKINSNIVNRRLSSTSNKEFSNQN